PSQPRGEPATVGGVNYTRFAVMTKLLYPTKAGRLTIPPMGLKIGLARQSFFHAGGAVDRSTKATAAPVKPIPDEPGLTSGGGRQRAGGRPHRQARRPKPRPARRAGPPPGVSGWGAAETGGGSTGGGSGG